MPEPSLLNAAPGAHRFAIGDFEATIVSDGEIEFDSLASEFPSTPAFEVDKLVEPSPPARRPPVLQLNCLVIKTGRQTLLFDAGMGATAMFGGRAGRLPDNLAAAGIDADRIDAVILTHLHCDHAWGLIDERSAPTFPRAQLFLSKAEFDSWSGEHGSKSGGSAPAWEIREMRRRLSPYGNRISFVVDGKEIFQGVTPVATPGHTSGHMSFLVESAGHRVLNIGDVCHHHGVQFANPRWFFRWDDDPAEAVRSRLKAFSMAADEGLELVGFHMPFPGVGRVQRQGDGFRFTPVSTVPSAIPLY